MTEVNFHVPKVEGVQMPQVGIGRFVFAVPDTGEVLADSKQPFRVCFNTSSDCMKRLENIFNSFLRGFVGGHDIALILELRHEVSDEELDLF